MVFRANGDVGKTRQCPTPQPELMLTKRNVFSEKWLTLKDINGISVFGRDTVHAIDNLKKRITTGCLSNVPPGAGTNRNERFHHHVNALLHKLQKHFQNVMLVGMASEISKNYTYKCVDRSRHNGIKGAKAKCAH